MTKWTDHEIKVLNINYKKNGPNIPELLKTRTVIAIHCKANKLDLTSNSRSLPKKWTDERINKLKREYSEKGTDIPELLEIFTRNAIWIKARSLNLKYKGKPKNRVNIPKDELIELYINQKKSTTEIAKIYNCSFGTILARLDEYNILKRKRIEGICIARGYHKSIKLNEHIFQILDGVLLSDGSYDFGGKDKKTASLKITQKEESKGWLDYLKTVFDDNNIECSISERISKIEGKGYPQCVFKTKYRIQFGDERKRWYPQGKKIVPEDIRLTPLVLAHWYMGDGNLGTTNRTKCGKKFYRINLCTDDFTKKENEFLRDKLKELYGWKFNVSKIRNNRYRLRNSQPKEIKDFLKRTSPYKIECFNYKWNALYDTNYVPIKTKWTKEMDDIIIKKSEEYGNNIQELLDLGISPNAIQKRKGELKKKNKDLDLSCNYVFNQYGKTLKNTPRKKEG